MTTPPPLPTAHPLSTTYPVPGPDGGARLRRIVIATLAVLAVTLLLVLSSSGAASAHEGHRTTDESAAVKAPTVTSSSIKARTVEAPTRTAESTRVARLAIQRLHLARINDVDTDTVFAGRRTSDDLVLVGGRGQANPLGVDCYVDFDDDLTMQYHVVGGAEDTFMTNHWFQKCFDDSYPAVAVKHLDYGHFHLGYEDPRVGPCEGNQTDWGRKAEPFPTGPGVDNGDIGEWVLAPCESDIDPITEPRSDISAHEPGHRGLIKAYDGDGNLPFTLRTLQVVSGEVEVCHLPAGPIVVANGGGSAWQCTTWDQGYWDMSDHVPSAIEVRFTFLTNGAIDNIGIDLL